MVCLSYVSCVFPFWSCSWLIKERRWMRELIVVRWSEQHVVWFERAPRMRDFDFVRRIAFNIFFYCNKTKMVAVYIYIQDSSAASRVRESRSIAFLRVYNIEPKPPLIMLNNWRQWMNRIATHTKSPRLIWLLAGGWRENGSAGGTLGMRSRREPGIRSR